MRRLWEEYKANGEQRALLNRLIRLYDMGDDYAKLIRRMERVEDPKTALGFYYPVLIRLRDLLADKFQLTAEVDVVRLRLIFSLCMIVLRNWQGGGAEEKPINESEAPIFRAIKGLGPLKFWNFPRMSP
jgi:hypothetical protein